MRLTSQLVAQLPEQLFSALAWPLRHSAELAAMTTPPRVAPAALRGAGAQLAAELPGLLFSALDTWPLADGVRLPAEGEPRRLAVIAVRRLGRPRPPGAAEISSEGKITYWEISSAVRRSGRPRLPWRNQKYLQKAQTHTGKYHRRCCAWAGSGPPGAAETSPEGRNAYWEISSAVRRPGRPRPPWRNLKYLQKA